MQPIDGYNADIAEEQRAKLRELFPEVFSEDKIDFDKLKATLGADLEVGERYGLSWKGKSEVFAKIQEKTTSTLHPQPEESVNWDTTQNMFIEGDNLEALKVLHKAYYGKIKMIYIDPPYNTGNDFVYNDDFKKTRREQALEEGAIDEEGNVTRDDGLRVNTGGHKHSNWLDMMYPRLFLARNLLRQDGVIFVSIDDNEVHNLRLMMNEIFGEENFITDIIWEKRFTRSNDAKMMASLVDHTLMYRRSDKLNFLREPRTEKADSIYNNPDNDPRGPWTSVSYVSQRTKDQRPNLSYEVTNPNNNSLVTHPTNAWKFSYDAYKKHEQEDRLFWGKEGGHTYPRLKKYLSELEGKGMVPINLWNYKDTGSIDEGTKEVDSLIGKDIFDYPKPTKLIKRMLAMTTSDDDIVMDFFGGSGTFAHATEELNATDGGARKWICVQLSENTEERSEAYRAGYKTIADISRERIRRAGTKISKDFADVISKRVTPLDLGFRSYVLDNSNFKKWNELLPNPDEARQATLDSLDPLEEGATDEKLLTEILLKRGISPLAEIEKHDDFVFVPSEYLVICLSRRMTEDLFTTILTKSPLKITLLDQSFGDNINLKTNLILQAEKQNILVEIL